MSAPVFSRAGLGGVLLAALLLLPVSARAWPVDQVFSVESGADRFHKLTAVEWVEVEDPSVATVEVLPGSNELLITGQAPGAHAPAALRRGEVRRVAADRDGAGRPAVPEAAPELLAAARKACPGLQVTEGRRALAVGHGEGHRVPQGAAGALPDGHLAGARAGAHLRAADAPGAALRAGAALKELGLEARYSGAGIVLQGTATPRDSPARAVGAVPPVGGPRATGGPGEGADALRARCGHAAPGCRSHPGGDSGQAGQAQAPVRGAHSLTTSSGTFRGCLGSQVCTLRLRHRNWAAWDRSSASTARRNICVLQGTEDAERRRVGHTP